MENFLELLKVITKEEGIILVLIALLFIDRFKSWVDLIDTARKKWLKIDRKEANKNLEDYAIKVGKIHEILEVYRESLNSARLGYYVFHNGGKDIRGIPFLKFSCINETTALGIRPRLKIDKDLHIATITEWTKALTMGNPIINTVGKLNTSGIRDLLSEYGIIKYTVMPIYEDSLLSGFILAEWKNDKYIPETDDIIREYILQCAKMIEVNSIKDINHFLSY